MIKKIISIFRNPLVYASIALLVLTSCVQIPKEAPELSAELGKRISFIEEAHIKLLHNFFDEKRNQVDKFVLEVWAPTFAEELFSSPEIEEIWGEIVKSNNRKDRLEFLVRIGPGLQSKINSKRMEYIKPLDELEKSIERKLREEYNQAKAINNSITSFLLSASKVAENRNRYLSIIGATDEKIVNVIDKIDSAVNILVGMSRTTIEKKQVTQEYMEKLKSILESFNNKKENKNDYRLGKI
jgi:hypothetical protein